jgi:PadR family transcriptional regulator PadR
MDILQGTLDLMVLKALHAMGPLHGYGIARRLEQVSGDAISLNQGTIYPALVRLLQQGWIGATWGTSENGRRAKYYAVTPLGVRQMKAQTEEWARMVDVMTRVLDI